MGLTRQQPQRNNDSAGQTPTFKIAVMRSQRCQATLTKSQSPLSHICMSLTHSFSFDSILRSGISHISTTNT
jgi:hypothetical protein